MNCNWHCDLNFAIFGATNTICKGLEGPDGHEVVVAGHRSYLLKEQDFQPAEAFYNFHSVTER